MASLYRQAVNEYLKNRSYKADQVLDVGGGDTSITKFTTIEANRIVVLDADPQYKPAFVHDLNNFSHPEQIFASERNPRFDLIFCMHVFEYIWNPYVAMANLHNWLPENGRLVVNFPFLYPLHNPVGIDYLRYTHEWVQKMFHEVYKFKDINVTILQASRGDSDLMRFWSNEQMHYRRGDDSWKEIGCIVEARK